MNQQSIDRNKTVAHDNYIALMKIIPEVIEGKYSIMRFQVNDDYMPLVFEQVMSNLYSLKHIDTYKGGTILDPEMELLIDSDNQTVNAVSFTQYPEDKKIVADGQTGQPLKTELNGFLSGWLKNIEEQGYKPEIAVLPPDKDLTDLKVYFNDERKPFNIAYIHHSNQIEVYNRLDNDGENGMKKIAQINSANSISFFENGIPIAVNSIIKDKALTANDIPKDIITDGKNTGQDLALSAQKAFFQLKSGDMVYLDEAVKPVQLISIRQGEALFVVPALSVEITRTHKDVMQCLKNHVGNKHLLEAAADKNQYDLQYVHTGDGYAVKSRLDENNGESKIIAQIYADRTVRIFDQNMPEGIKEKIRLKARTSDKSFFSEQQEQNVFRTSPFPYKLEYHDIPVYGVEIYNELLEQIANVLDNGRIEYMNDDIPQSARNEIEQFAANRAIEREAEFFNMEGDAYGIYLFEPKPDDSRGVKENYRLAWFGKKEESDTLDTIRAEFSGIEQPHYDFLPRENGIKFGSLDIIALKEDGKVTAWLVQNYSFYRERDFFGKYTTEPEIKVMPDQSITTVDRDTYGYRYDGILPLTEQRATELFNADLTIYRLYPDNTEGMVFELEEIPRHDGIFGIETADWLASREYAEMVKTLEHGAASQEAALIFGNDNAFGLYQLKRGDETRDYRFEPFDRLVSRGLEVERRNYELVYHAPLLDGETLDSLFTRFNVDRPVYFSGHSLSVSDVIVIQCDGELTSHYVDDIGFKELTAFLGNEHRIEHEDTYSYIDLLREHISNHFEAGYLTETQAQVLYSNMDSLNEKMLAITSLYESGIPLDVETDTIDRLFRDELAQSPEQTEPTPDKQTIPDTRPKDVKYSIMADLKAKINAIAQESSTEKNAAKDSKKEVVGHG